MTDYDRIIQENIRHELHEVNRIARSNKPLNLVDVLIFIGGVAAILYIVSL